MRTTGEWRSVTASGQSTSTGLGFTTEAISARARVKAQAGDHAGAAAAYRILADLDPEDLRTGMRLSRHLVAVGRFREATDEYLRLAVVFARQGAQRRALTVATHAMRMDPSRGTPRRLAPLLVSMGGRVQELCEEAARLHLVAGRPADATEIHRLLAERDPESLAKRLRFAELALAEGRTTEGLAALHAVARGLHAQRRTREFIRIAEMIHAHGGADAWSLRELARCYQRDGKPHLAQRKLLALLRVSPSDLYALEGLGWVSGATDEPVKAAAYLVRLIRLMAQTHDRGELREVFARADHWSADPAYQRRLEVLRVATLCQGTMPRRSLHSGLPRSVATPPPPPPGGRIAIEFVEATPAS